MLAKRADHTRYRKEEKEEVINSIFLNIGNYLLQLVNRYRDHKDKFEKWIEELKEKRMESMFER